MSYDPVTYWPARYRADGPTYVAFRGKGPLRQALSYENQLAALDAPLRELVRGPRVLDFGCGPGRFRPSLSRDGELGYTGVDLIPGLGTEPLGEHLPGGFDSAVALFVLQHIVAEDEYRRWARELFDCLRPGGRLVVVDCLPFPNPAVHMAPRGPAALLGAAPWLAVHVVREYAGHWVGWLERGP